MMGIRLPELALVLMTLTTAGVFYVPLSLAGVPGGALTGVVNATMAVAMVVLLIGDRRWQQQAIHPALICMVFFGFSYYVWAECRSDVLLRTALLLLNLAAAWLVTASVSPRRCIELLGSTNVALLFVSLLVIFVFPSVGTNSDARTLFGNNAWLGIFRHKNLFGAFVLQVQAFLFFLHLRGKGPFAGRLAFLSLLALLTSICALSGSALSTGLSFLMLGYGCLHASEWKPPRLSWPLTIGAIGLLLGIGYLMYDVAIAVLGRDSSLTGRTALWAACWRYFLDRPLLGYGYGGFWAVEGGPGDRMKQEMAYEFFDAVRAFVHAHNGYLDLLLHFGALGTLALVWLGIGVIRGLWSGVSGPSKADLRIWFGMTLVQLVLVNVVESFLVTTNLYPTLLLSLGLCYYYQNRPEGASSVRVP